MLINSMEHVRRRQHNIALVSCKVFIARYKITLTLQNDIKLKFLMPVQRNIGKVFGNIRDIVRKRLVGCAGGVPLMRLFPYYHHKSIIVSVYDIIGVDFFSNM